MPRDENGEVHLLLPAERLALRVALHACQRAGYVRAAQSLEAALARDNAEVGPRCTPIAHRWNDDNR